MCLFRNIYHQAEVGVSFTSTAAPAVPDIFNHVNPPGSDDNVEVFCDNLKLVVDIVTLELPLKLVLPLASLDNEIVLAVANLVALAALPL